MKNKENLSNSKMNLPTRIVKTLIITLMGLVSLIYMINPTAGILELIPDNIPFVGNIDEAGAAGVFISCLRYFGIDVCRILPLGSMANDRKPK